MIIHPHTRQQLDQFLSSPVHAVGLQGDEGAGKGYLAQYLADQLIGLGNPYLRVADAGTPKFGIEDVRMLQKFLTLTVPGRSAIKRVLIIERIHSLGTEAQNALLKTLEEPPTDTIIIVTYTRDTAILKTIHSRLRRVAVLPVDCNTVQEALPGKDTAKTFHISGGQVGLLYALLDGEEDHLLVQAIQSAKEILGMTRYQRLSGIESLTKKSTVPAELLLDGLYRLLDAGYHQAVQSKPRDVLQSNVRRMKLVERAIHDLNANVQAKLVFTRLFIEL